MPLITDMQLPELPVETPAFHSDPMTFVDAAREVHPWLARFHGGYVIHGYQALKDLAFMDEMLEMGLDNVAEFYQVQGTPIADFLSGMLNSNTGADHRRLRDSIARAFTPRSANRARPLMQEKITELLDEWVPRGEFDFADFASYFPVSVLCGVLGVSSEPIGRIRSAIESYMKIFTLQRELVPELTAAYDTLWNFVDDLVLEREKESRVVDIDPNDSGLLDVLIATKNAGNLTEKELRYMLLVLFIGGYDTSKNILTLIMYKMLQHPDYWARCAEDLKFCGKVIEEILRYSNIATTFRNVRQEFDYEGHRFPKGVLVAFATPLANRDPQAFPDPMRFDPERVDENKHLAFGRGAHICPGQFLARAQLQEGLQLIAQRIPHPQLAGEIGWRPFLGAWGLSTLPISVGAD